MTSRKHRGSDDNDQPKAKTARLEMEGSGPSQQKIAKESDLSETLGNYKIEVKLRSKSKAIRNDPKFTLSQREIYRKTLAELSKQGTTAGDHHFMASLAALQHSPDHETDQPVDETRTNQERDDSIQSKKEVLHENIVDAEKRNDGKNNAEDNQKDETPTGKNRKHYDGQEQQDNEKQDDDQRTYDEEDICADENIYDNNEEDGDDDNDDEEDGSEYDPDFEFEWLEPIDVKATSTSTSNGSDKPKNIAYCHAKLIRRNRMRDNFYTEMERPSNETSMLGFDLFDRYGRLKPEFKDHPIIKGTGVWGQEVDRGDILLIEEIFVDQACRRQGLGRKMTQALLEVVKQKTWSFFTFVWPTMMRRGDIGMEFDSLQDDAAKDEMEDREQDRAIVFWRSQGFRRVGSTIWFAMTPDDDHPSHKLASTDDFDPPKAPATTLDPLLHPFQQRSLPPSSEQILASHQPSEPDFLGVLESCLQAKGSDDACWTSQDKYGNTVLHLAVARFNVACVEWILKQGFGAQLLQLRNNRGEIPLESLQFKLEKLRTQKRINLFTASVSDRFQGHDEKAVRCLVLLKGLGSLESFVQSKGPVALQRMVRGCTCGQCLNGFLSPRMLHALHTQAEMGYDNLAYDLEESGPTWAEYNEDSLKYLPSRVRANLKTNKSMRQGFVNLWKHIATCLEKGNVPSGPNVLAIVRDAGEWPPATRNFLERGGTVESVFLSICRIAMTQDEWTGDGSHQDIFGDEVGKLPECRNDLEFGYVSGSCGYRRISLVRNVDVWGNTLDEDGNLIDSLL